MKRDWTAEDIVEHFTVSASEMEMIGVNDPNNKLDKAVLLKWFPLEGRFPENATEVPQAVIVYVASQLRLSAPGSSKRGKFYCRKLTEKGRFLYKGNDV